MTKLVPVSPNPASLLQKLIQYDTTNPPGNESACIGYIDDLLKSAGIDTALLAADEERPNLIARLPGDHSAPPLLLQGHVDVVTTRGQQWQHPPFGGEEHEGMIWGRGALDMKGGVAMMVSALLRLKEEGVTPPGDVILTILSDEEAGGDFGAKFLVEKHPEQFEGVRYALGEFGGFSLHIAGKRFYPIMVAEKQVCWMKLMVRGPGGHGSMPVQDGAMARMGQILSRLDQKRPPVHVTPVVRQMMEGIKSAVPGRAGFLMGQLLNPMLTDHVLKLMGDSARSFSPLFRNTVSPTILRGGEKINVIPNEVSLELDGRLLPGYRPEDMIAELKPIVGPGADIEVVQFDPGPPEPDMGLFDMLAGVLSEADPDGTPIPLLLGAVTDARFFARLGIQTYGFLPMNLPADFNFSATIHAADERVPVDALEFGTDAVTSALQRFGA